MCLQAKYYQEGWELSQKEYKLQQKRQKSGQRTLNSTASHKLVCLLVLFLCFQIEGYSQKLTQTIRGKIIDQESQAPIMGATVVIDNSNPLKGASSGMDGTFEIKEVAVGRHNLKVSTIGYEEAVIPELLVGSGKEVVLTVRLQEVYTRLNEVVVTSIPEKAQPINEMATVSARSFSVEETQRYAASLNDPGRMVLSFAGVSSNNDASNEIVVRGNSPRGVSWRIEGIEVPNPNHFGEEGSAGGGVSMMSANMMDASDFYTGAFPAEYGNAYSGVFDINLRKGNNRKREYAVQAGVLGVDFAAEGPFTKEYSGSYLINYRYSTLGILQSMGLDFFDGAAPIFQDLSYKIFLPTKKAGTFNFWGIGGLSNQKINGEEMNYDYRYNMGVSGLSHRIMLSDKTFLESIVTAARSINAFEHHEPQKPFFYHDQFGKSNFRGSFLINHKLNNNNTFRGGLTASHEAYDLLQEFVAADTSATELDTEGSSQLYQAYGQWKARLTKSVTLNTGLHAMLLGLNNNYSIEPRIGFRWQVATNQVLNAGFGVHSKMEPLLIYFYKYKNNSMPNKELNFMRAFHYIIGYEYSFAPDWMLKAEAYYQQLRNVPIAGEGTDNPEWLTYSTINYGGDVVRQPLENDGSGRNYGIELSIEKFFTNNYYLTVTGSLYESKYTPRDGIERNSRYNGNFNANLLFGKEFHVGSAGNNIIGINIRTLTSGGNRWTPVLPEESLRKGEEVKDWSRVYSERQGMYFRTDVRLSFRRNKPTRASIWSLDVQNATNNQNVWSKGYDEEKGEVVTYYQMGLLPVLSYRIEF